MKPRNVKMQINGNFLFGPETLDHTPILPARDIVKQFLSGAHPQRVRDPSTVELPNIPPLFA